MSVQVNDTTLAKFFPVYDLLFNQINSLSDKDRPLDEGETKILINKINSLDKMGRDMIFVFIRLHSLRNSNSKLLDLPYKGEKLNNKVEGTEILCDVKFDVRQFPPILSRALDRFATLHLRRMQEDGLKTNPSK